MSQPTNPYNRPLPPEIYRRRRIAAGVGLLVIVVVLVLIVRAIAGGGGSDGTAADASTSTSPTLHRSTSTASSTTAATDASASGSAEASGTEAGAAASEGEKSTSASSTAEPGAQCSLEDLELSVQAGAPTYAAGVAPDFYLTVTNPTESNCTVDLADNPMSFEVFTLTDYTRIWADTDCNEPTSEESIELEPGASRNFALNGWSRTTSAPGECTDRADAGTGAFLLYGHVGDRTSEPATFNLA